MPDARPAAPKRRHGGIAALARLIASQGLGLLRRGYALGVIVLIVWMSWSAVRYLIVSLLTPTKTPAQIAGVPRRLDEPVLHAQPMDWLGLSSVDNPRGPLAHYHRFETWLQSDRFNDCARSGCHAPLPHSKRKEVRAFLNMHATSIHCGVCHMNSEATPLPLAWYNLNDGHAGDPPALMAAYSWLEAHAPNGPERTWTKSDQDVIIELLRKSDRQAGGGTEMARCADRLWAVRPSSDSFAHLLDEAHQIEVRAFRGSYGSKIAVRGGDGQPVLGHPETDQAVREFLATNPQSPEQREALLKRIHPRKRPEALACHSCHTPDKSLIDFAGLGYPPARVQALISSPVMRMIERISGGEPFYLPQVGGPVEPTASQPVKP